MYFSGTIKSENHFTAYFQVPSENKTKQNPASIQWSLRSCVMWSHLPLCPNSTTLLPTLQAHGLTPTPPSFQLPSCPRASAHPQGTIRAPTAISNVKSQLFFQGALPDHTNIPPAPHAPIAPLARFSSSPSYPLAHPVLPP